MATLQKLRESKLKRALGFAEEFESGSTLQEIGDRYGISRERVRQLLLSVGVTGQDGGQRRRSERQRRIKTQEAESKFARKMGMTRSEFRKINYQERYQDRPHHKYREQKHNSNNRGIEWKMTFGEWWFIWQQSGKWELRGRGTGYVMARFADSGPYEVGNVEIVSGSDNQSEYINRYWDEVRSGKRRMPKGTPRIYPWDEMECGDSFLIPHGRVKMNSIRCTVSNRKHYGELYVIKSENHGIRIWRIAMTEPTTYKVEKDIPIPEHGRTKHKFPFAEMDVSDSFFIPDTNTNRIGNAYTAAKKANIKITIKAEGTGVRVWRKA